MAYKVLHHRLFEKEVLKIPTYHQQKAYKLISAIAKNPKKLPANTVQLGGIENVYRTRIGDFRLIYHLNSAKKSIFVLGIASRGSIYKLIRRLLG